MRNQVVELPRVIDQEGLDANNHERDLERRLMQETHVLGLGTRSGSSPPSHGPC
jgi:hypothetical protein